MQEDPNQREDEKREASDESVVEGDRDDSVAGHMFRGPVERVNEPGRVGEAGIRIADPEK